MYYDVHMAWSLDEMPARDNPESKTARNKTTQVVNCKVPMVKANSSKD